MALSAVRLEELSTLFLFATLCVVVVRLGFLSLAVLRLKSRHHAKWLELECPTSAKWAKSRNYFSRAGAYKELSDQVLDSYVLVSRLAGYVSVAALLGLLVLIIVTFIVVQSAPHVSAAEVGATRPQIAVGIVLLACVAGYIASVSLAIGRLRKFHQTTWQALECPAFLGGHSRFLEFVWARRDREIDDPRFSNLVLAMKIFALGFFALFAFVVLRALRP